MHQDRLPPPSPAPFEVDSCLSKASSPQCSLDQAIPYQMKHNIILFTYFVFPNQTMVLVSTTLASVPDGKGERPAHDSYIDFLPRIAAAPEEAHEAADAVRCARLQARHWSVMCVSDEDHCAVLSTRGSGETCPFGTGAALMPATAATIRATTEIFMSGVRLLLFGCSDRGFKSRPWSSPFEMRELFQAPATLRCWWLCVYLV